MNDWREIARGRAACAFCRCLLLVALVGCQASSVKTYPVKGKVEIKDGDVAPLTGSHVELRHESEEALRPSGRIEPDGSFAIQTLYQGKVVSGAPEGKYKVRIVLGDESDAGVPKRKGDPIHKRFYDFATSGLTLTVPSGDYTLAATKK